MAVYDFTFQIQDADGDNATFEVHTPSGLTLAQYTEGIQALSLLLDSIIAGIISFVSFVLNVDISALVGNIADINSDVEEIGAYAFTSSANFPVKLNIPGVNELDVAAGSDELNQADPQIAAVISMMLSGIAVTGGTIIPCDKDGNDLTTLNYARENFRASGRRS